MPTAARDIWTIQGPLMWTQLHHWALTCDPAQGADWLRRFSARIPCGECKRHWHDLLKKMPPDFSSTDALFAWTAQAHNAVNTRLGKPDLPLESAAKHWKSAPAPPGFFLPPHPRPPAEPSRITKEPLIDCQHAAQTPRPHFVTCALARYGGTPHVAICADCPSRKPKNSPHLPTPLATGLAPARHTPATLASPTPPPPKNSPTPLLLRSHLSPGDIVMLTAAVRDLHKSHPGRFLTAVDTSAPELWENNPLITPIDPKFPTLRTINMHYPLINHSNQRPVHFLQGYAEFLEQQLDLKIPVTAFRGDIHLSEQEKSWTNQVQQTFAYKGQFWIIVAGGKYDFTTKWWPPEYYQSVVDHFLGKLQFVQCGEKDHWHPPLNGVFNLVGKTSLRQFVRLMYHAQGVLCPVTFAMHLAAAVPSKQKRNRPCVVVAGGREPPHWEAYPGHQFLHTLGALPCCATGGCWKSRCQQVGDRDRKDHANTCDRPVQFRDDLRVPQCMAMIKPAHVIDAVERYLAYQE